MLADTASDSGVGGWSRSRGIPMYLNQSVFQFRVSLSLFGGICILIASKRQVGALGSSCLSYAFEVIGLSSTEPI